MIISRRRTMAGHRRAGRYDRRIGCSFCAGIRPSDPPCNRRPCESRRDRRSRRIRRCDRSGRRAPPRGTAISENTGNRDRSCGRRRSPGNRGSQPRDREGDSP